MPRKRKKQQIWKEVSSPAVKRQDLTGTEEIGFDSTGQEGQEAKEGLIIWVRGQIETPEPQPHRARKED